MVSGNVIGVIWRSEDYSNLSPEDLDKLSANHKKIAVKWSGAFVEKVPSICMYFDYRDGQTEMHMIFTQAVRGKYLEGNGFTKKDLIFKTEENSHLVEEARFQYEAHLDELNFDEE